MFGNLGHSNFEFVSDFDLPAHVSLGRVHQPPQAMRQEQIGAIIQTGQWQAGIRISNLSTQLKRLTGRAY